MFCTRCHGLMVVDSTLDMDIEVERNGGCSQIWRCVVCGERVDPTILRNRAASGSIEELRRTLVDESIVQKGADHAEPPSPAGEREYFKQHVKGVCVRGKK